MTFAEIEEVLGSTLPPWAYEYQAWWANDKSHSQARAWLGAGWKTTHANVNEKSVVFVRFRLLLGVAHASILGVRVKP